MNETRPVSIPGDEGARRNRAMRRRRTRRLVLLVVVPVVIVIAATIGWLFTGGTVSTDDSYVKAYRISIVPRVSGKVVEVAVGENQAVSAGQLLFRVDPEPYRLALARAEAELAAARLDVDALKAGYRQKLAQLKAAQDSAEYWSREYERQRALVNHSDISVSKFEQIRSFMDTARFMADSMQQSVNASLQALGGDPNIPTDQHPKVKAALAMRDRARLELSYTDVTAPTDAYVAQTTLQPGAWVQVGVPVFDIFSRREEWVEGDFKETDLTDVRPGQPATVTVDTYPGRVFHGRVASISPATGAEFALLPAQNASGNWVKVVQRIPVRIAIEPEAGAPPLRSGMSATIEITTGRRHSLADLLPEGLFSATAAPSSGEGR